MNAAIDEEPSVLSCLLQCLRCRASALKGHGTGSVCAPRYNESCTTVMEGLLEAHARVKQYYSYIVMRQLKNAPIPASGLVWPGIDVAESAAGAAKMTGARI
ncbi:MAG: hypothetical protein ACREVI_04015 [Steroidobacteraceae bacterium]